MNKDLISECVQEIVSKVVWLEHVVPGELLGEATDIPICIIGLIKASSFLVLSRPRDISSLQTSAVSVKL